MPHMLTPAELKLLHPRRRLAPFSPPTPLELMLGAEEEEGGDDGGAQHKVSCLRTCSLHVWAARRCCRLATSCSSSSSLADVHRRVCACCLVCRALMR
jgi:hypothetical protein